MAAGSLTAGAGTGPPTDATDEACCPPDGATCGSADDSASRASPRSGLCWGLGCAGAWVPGGPAVARAVGRFASHVMAYGHPCD